MPARAALAANIVHAVFLPIFRSPLTDSSNERMIGESQWISTTGMCARCKTRVATDPNTMFDSAVIPRVPM